MEATDRLSVEQAAESLLQPAQEPEIESEETVEAEVDEAPGEPTEEIEAEAEEADAEADGEEISEDDETDEDDADQDGPETFTVKVAGEEVEVTLDDLKRSYSGQEYIQKGMKETAELRKAVDAERQQAKQIFEALQAERAQLAEFGKQLQETGLRAPEPPSADLINTDPIAYMEERARYEQEKAAYDQNVQKYEQLTAQQRQAETQARQAYLREQAQRLSEMVPEFADAERAGDFKTKILKSGVDNYGFSEAELAQIMDARQVAVLADAMKWRELQANKTRTTEQAKKKARPVVKAAAKAKADPKRKQREQAKQRLKQTGSIQDAVSLIMDS